jgi:N6-adenosine-specific RNA methylase IME4
VSPDAWIFGSLRMFGYDLIVADPPWAFDLYSEKGEEKSAQAHYACMPLDAIKAMRVGELARGDCLLLMWATECMRPQAHEVMAAWGFSYKSAFIWRKVTANGKPRMGTGYRVRSMHEPVLVGTIGNPRHKPFPSVFDGVARQHSRKPESFFQLLDSQVPPCARAELFGRQQRAGWDVWGNETGKFAEGVAA